MKTNKFMPENMVAQMPTRGSTVAAGRAGAGAPGGDDVAPQAVMLPNHVDDGTSG